MGAAPVRSGIIWDLDHTLYETHPDMQDAWYDAFYHAAQVHGLGHTRDETAGLVNQGHKRYGNAIRYYSLELGVDEGAFYRSILEAIEVQGINECLKTQRMLGTLPVGRMAILTSANKDWARIVLEKIGLAGMFGDGRIVSLDETGGLLKSQSPVPFEMAARVVGLPVEAHIMVDDTAVNLKIAKDLGMATVLVTHGAVFDVPSHVDFVVDKAYDVIRLINEGAISWASVSHS